MTRFPGNLAPHFDAGDRDTPIDKFKVTLGGEEMSLRQAGHRLLHEPSLNFLEERKLLGLVKLIEERKFTRTDLETALESWGLSRGKSSMNYFLAIIDRMLEEKKRYQLQHRPHESRTNRTDEKKIKTFDDDYEAEQFADFLRSQDVPHRYGRDPGSRQSVVYADNVHQLYKTFERLSNSSNLPSHSERVTGGECSFRGDPRPPTQPPDDATARLAMPGADASQCLTGGDE